MKKQVFETRELQEALEQSLGFHLQSLTRLDGAAALNFKAIRSSDGMTFAVKCSPPSSKRLYDCLVEHLKVLTGSKAVQRVFEEECVPVFYEHNVLCTLWSFGKHMFPDELTDEQFVACLNDYLDFSEAMQKTKMYGDVREIKQWRDDAFKKCKGLTGLIMRRILREIEPEVCDYRKELLRIIHGDFHHGNFLFVNGRVDRYLDLEEFRLGYPTDDLLRFFVCAAEHLRWYAIFRERHILKKFTLAVRYLKYSKHEWLTAINGRFICKMYMRTRKVNTFGLGQVLNLWWRYGIYRKMRRIVNEVLT